MKMAPQEEGGGTENWTRQVIVKHRKYRGWHAVEPSEWWNLYCV